MRDIELIREGADGAVLRGHETGAGPTVLLLHAGGERRTVWEPVAQALDEGGVRSVAFDQRGHGDSSGEPTTLAMLAGDVRAMIRQQQRPVTIVGASIGGLAGLDALTDPATAIRARGLVLVDVVPDPDPGRVRTWLDERGLRRRREALVDDVLAQGPALRAALAALDLPILLVRGGVGSPLSDAEVVRLQETNLQVRVERIPEAGHLVARDAPQRLAAIILERTAAWHHDQRSLSGDCSVR
jgi:pimeloyl-ACP methyl ester carboxylesterase